MITTVLRSVQQTQVQLVRQQLVRTALLSLSAVLMCALVLLVAGAPKGWTVSTVLVAPLAWVVLARRTAWPSVQQAALWVEERAISDARARASGVSSDFALVTCVELLADGREVTPALLTAAEQVLARSPVPAALSARRRRRWGGPLLFVTLAGVLLAVVVRRSEAPVLRAVGGNAAGAGSTSADAAVAPLGAWAVRVIPPAYTAQAPRSFGDATSVVALTGSRVDVRGDGAAPSVQEQRVGDRTSTMRDVEERHGAWRTHAVADSRPTSMTIARGGRSRLLVIEGHPDSIPTVMLQLPARDSVFREATGRLPMLAVLRDDIGLAQAQFELIVTSGEGERFTVRTVTAGAAVWPRGAVRAARITGTLDLAALKLQPGDVVHLRAVARDAHPGPARALGSSETRAFRIARPSEMDSVAVEPAPPPEVDTSLLSQRMLLMLTEKLDKAQRRMARPEVVRESLRIARDQARLRLAVGDVVFQRLSGESSAEHAHYAGDGHEHGVDQQGGKLSMSTSATTGMLEEGNDSPVVAINQPLLEAYNAMWDAGRALEQGEPHAAIPPMKRALEAIERSRAASRLYLRGRPPQVIVDINKVRLAGKDTGQQTTRSSREMLPARAAARDSRLLTVAPLLQREDQRSAARDSLVLLRAEALGDAPAFAAAIARVLRVVEQGGDATASLVDARRALGTVVRTTVVPWSRGVPP
ncbi:hypothetical protein [Gemmatimonas sp.]|jgi:hypothetical protein|uniref:hypothetical protein n=1 Tax=Gemmatimonas sp. TaxID=1962908 RepID=UPI0037C074CC